MRYSSRVILRPRFLSSCSTRESRSLPADHVHVIPNSFILSETRGKTLEEIAEIFGDDLAFTEYIGARSSDSEQEPAKTHAMAQDADTEYIEQVGRHKGI
jgi:hypothetical protein